MDRKVLLNRMDDPRLSECVYVGKGDKVYASHAADEWGFTVGKQYEILDVSVFGYLTMKNDNGEVDDYDVDYFKANEPFVSEG